MVDKTRIYEALFAQAPDAMIFADREGVIREWNEAATRIFGHAPHHAVGQSLDLIIPEEFRRAHWKGYDRALDTGETKYCGQALVTRSVHEDGHKIYVELTFALVRGDDGEILGAVAHARDCTERWQVERERRQRMRELEAQLAAQSGG